MHQEARRRADLGEATMDELWDGRNFWYAKSGGTGTLRKHLDRWHREEYERDVKNQLYTNQLPSFKMKQKLLTEVVGATEAFEEARPQFLIKELHKHIVNFVVGGDQVR